MNSSNYTNNNNKTQDNDAAENELYSKEEPMSWWSKIKIISGVCSLIFGIVLIYMANTGKLTTVTNDIFSQASKDANPYIEMVQDIAPLDNGRSYKTAYDQAFKSNNWTYFMPDDKRIVQVTSEYEGYEEKIITQFLVTPSEEDSEEFLIEPYAMRIGNYQLSTTEMELVIMSIFSDEIGQIMAELFGY